MVRMSSLFKVMAIMAILLGISYTADAQLGGVLNKAKNKAVQQIQHNQSQTDKTQNGKSQQQNSTEPKTSQSTSKPKTDMELINSTAMEKMSKYKTPYEYNSQIAASVTKNSSPVDICRAFIFYQFEFKNRNLDIVLGPKEQVRMVTDYVMVEDGIDLDKLEKSLDELATVTPWKAPWESLEGKSMNDFQSVMAGAADSGLSPWGESWSDHDVVVEFLNEKRNGKCYDFNSLCKYFVTQAYKINKSSIPDVTPYIREQLDKIAKYKTVSAKMCLLRDILYQIDVYIVQNGRFYPTNENIYIDEIKTVYDQMPADSIATLEIKFRTIEQLDRDRAIYCKNNAKVTVQKPSSRDVASETKFKNYFKTEFPSMQVVDVICASDATADWDINKNSVGIPNYREKIAIVIIKDSEHPDLNIKLKKDFIVKQDYIGGGQFGSSRIQEAHPSIGKHYLYTKNKWFAVKE